MNDSKEKLLRIAVIVGGVAVIGLIIWASLRRPANNANFPEGNPYLCQNEGCGNEFTMTMRELGQHHERNYGQPIPCPKCEKGETVAAQRCPQCGRHYPQVRGGSPCPYCNPAAAAEKAAKNKGGTKKSKAKSNR